MIYDNLITAIGTQRGLNGLCDRAASVDVANDCSIFGIIAVVGVVSYVVCLEISFEEAYF